MPVHGDESRGSKLIFWHEVVLDDEMTEVFPNSSHIPGCTCRGVPVEDDLDVTRISRPDHLTASCTVLKRTMTDQSKQTASV